MEAWAWSVAPERDAKTIAAERGQTLNHPMDPHTAPPLMVGSLPGPTVRTLLITDLVDSTALVRKLGNERASEVAARHDRIARDLLPTFGGVEIDKTDGFLLLFERPVNAVRYALAYHQALEELSVELGLQLLARAGMHLGEVMLRRNSPEDVARGAKLLEVEGLAKPIAARTASLALARQTLITRGAFNLAREAAATELPADQVRWLAHGPYLFQGLDEPLEVFEVGTVDHAPFTAPPGSPKAQRAVALGDEVTLGWRAAAGQEIPQRPSWILQDRLGEGGFGEVWSAGHRHTGEKRVFKFCYHAQHLRSLKREVTLFRLLKESLGNREDIARVLDWNFDQAPYFLESEYTEGGDLDAWAEAQGGLKQVPLNTRLELVAQIAEALAAAHSVGVLHKDVKPRNILVTTDPQGAPKARLTDFGIGLITDQRMLLEKGITVSGMTELPLSTPESARTGTRLYMPPESLEGKPPTIQADIYALGVLLYQIVAGDFHHALATGWRRDVEDDLLAEDIAATVDGSPDRRLADAQELARRLRSLETRRREKQREEEERQQARRARRALERSQRRRRISAVIAAVSLLVATVVGILAYQAIEARREAELRQEQAENLIGFMIGDLHEKLIPLGKLEILNDVGNKAVEYFATVPPEKLSNAELARHAEALYQIGEVRKQEGNLEGALAAFRQSLPLVEDLTRRNSTRQEWWLLLANDHFGIGSCRWRQDDLEGALKHFQSQLAITQRLAEENPDDGDLELNLAFAHSNIGFVQRARGDLDAALASFLDSLALKRRSEERAPEDLERKHQVARQHNLVGLIALEQGDLAQAQTAFEEDHRLAQELVQADPEVPRYKVRLATSHHYLGRLLLIRGSLEAAEEHLRASVEIMQALTRQDPTNSDWQRQLGVGLRRMARVHALQQRFPEGLRLAERSVAIHRGLQQINPAQPGWQRDFILALTQLGILELLNQQREAATDHGAEAMEQVQRLTSQAPGNADNLLPILEARLLVGLSRQALGEEDEARALWRQAVAESQAPMANCHSPEVLFPWAAILLRSDDPQAGERVLRQLESLGAPRDVTLQSIP
jgi:eukaryotic-like serine/threonine-protein kinase